jgi:DNA topoisomerase IB
MSSAPPSGYLHVARRPSPAAAGRRGTNACRAEFPSGRFGSLASAVTDAAVNGVEVERRPTKPRSGASPSAIALARRLGLRHVTTDALSIRRRRCGRGWIYIGVNDRVIRDRATVRRLARLAVPPAYQDVLYARDASAHLQAIGRDAAGRLQYRYHPRWDDVRELRKARRLARLADVLPRIHKSIGRCLAAAEESREFTCAAAIELVARSAIRPGSESYVRLHGTRGAVTLLKSNVDIYGDTLTLRFQSKGGKIVSKEFDAPRLAGAIARLRQLPGRRLFQCRSESGDVRSVTAQGLQCRQRAGASAAGVQPRGAEIHGAELGPPGNRRLPRLHGPPRPTGIARLHDPSECDELRSREDRGSIVMNIDGLLIFRSRPAARAVFRFI